MKGFVRNLVSILKRILKCPQPLCPTNPDSQPTIVNQHGIGFLQRPWIRVKHDSNPEAIFVLAKRNYKVYANLGLTVRSTKRFVVILDTGAGSSFITLGSIPQAMRKEIHTLKDEPNIRNASGKSVPIVGTIDLMVQIGTSSEFVTFYVSENLATSVILGCYFCDHHVEAIKPRLTVVEMDDGSMVPIVRQPSKPNANLPLPEEQTFTPRKKRQSTKIKTTRSVKLQP